MKPPQIALEHIRELGRPCLRSTIPKHWEDANGHMNMRWYVALFDDAGDDLHDVLGLTAEYHLENGTGTMDLEHHTHFLHEVTAGGEVSIYARAIESNAKRLHYVMFLVDETRGNLASIFECMNAFVDLRVRKSAPWPDEIRLRIEEMVASHKHLTWEAPVSRSMSVFSGSS